MVEPLSTPVKVRVCVAATAVRVTFAPLTVPVTGADPLLQRVGRLPDCGGKKIEYVMAPLTEPLFC